MEKSSRPWFNITPVVTKNLYFISLRNPTNDEIPGGGTQLESRWFYQSGLEFGKTTLLILNH